MFVSRPMTSLVLPNPHGLPVKQSGRDLKDEGERSQKFLKSETEN